MGLPSTGGYIIGDTSGCVDGVRIPVSKGIVLFSSETPLDQVVSASVTVSPGNAIIVAAYDIPPGGIIHTNYVIIGSYQPVAAEHCVCSDGGYTLDPITILASERMTIGGEELWQFSAKRRQMVISLPGVYTFEVADVAMLGKDLHMEYNRYDLSDVRLPDVYFAGVAYG